MDDKSDHDLLIEIHTLLIGSREAPGLVPQVRECRRDCDASIAGIRQCMARLKWRFALVIGILIGLGILELAVLR